MTGAGWTEIAELDKSIEIQYWSSAVNGGKNTAEYYVSRGHNVYNFAREYTYYTAIAKKSTIDE